MQQIVSVYIICIKGELLVKFCLSLCISIKIFNEIISGDCLDRRSLSNHMNPLKVERVLWLVTEWDGREMGIVKEFDIKRLLLLN